MKIVGENVGKWLSVPDLFLNICCYFILYAHVYVWVWIYAYECRALKGKKRGSDPMELKLLEPEPASSARAVWDLLINEPPQ